ncbi:MAG TPA: DUF1059 domain-containing protein [Candidatus Nitrosotenuis sp.]|nr:DUF1059 domain-containing protein [Candidatus Nitrosotenuis sp.]
MHQRTLYHIAKKFACGDVVNGCGWSATTNDETELFQKLLSMQKKITTCLPSQTR